MISGSPSRLAASEAARDPRRPAVVPGRLDQQPAGVLAAGLGDRPAPAALAGGVLGRHDAEIAHDLRRVPEAVEVADLRAQPGGGQRVDPAQTHQPPGGLRPRRLGQRPRDLGLELLAADHQRAAPRRDSPPSARCDAGCASRTPASQPQMRLGPVGLRPVEADLVTQQQLRQPMARAHQIAAQILARTHQVAQRLLLDARHRDAMQLTGGEQPHQPLGVATIGLDAIARPARDQPRRADQTVHARPPAACARARTPSARPHRSRAPAPATPPRTPPPPRCDPATAAPAARPNRDPASRRPHR